MVNKMLKLELIWVEFASECSDCMDRWLAQNISVANLFWELCHNKTGKHSEGGKTSVFYYSYSYTKANTPTLLTGKTWMTRLLVLAENS